MSHRCTGGPRFSVVMPAYDTPEPLLRAAVASVQAQFYPDWELCIADDASPSPGVANLLQTLAADDPRIRWTRRASNGHISEATNSALALATGEFVVLMDHDDLLPPHALYEVAVELARHPDADVIYSDEDKVDLGGRRFDPYFKPAWSPELLSGHNVVSHLGVYRRSLIEEIGGLRTGFEGSQDWDLALRATAATTPDRVRHIPAILYHWRWDPASASFSQTVLERCIDAGHRAVSDWLDGEGASGATLRPARLVQGWTHVTYGLPDPAPTVSIVMLNGPEDELAAWRAITDWPAERLEIVAVHDGPARPRPVPGVRFVEAPRGRSEAALLNHGSAAAQGSILVILTTRFEPVEPAWMRELAGLVGRHEIGIAGAKLLDQAGMVQHAGVFLDGGDASILRGAGWDDPGYFGQFALARQLSAVAGGCLAMRRDVWDEVGGLTETLGGSAAEIDLCERIRDLGYRVVWTPEAILRYRPEAALPTDVDLGRGGDCDPFHNANIILHPSSYRVPAHSRRRKSWLT